MGGVDTLSTEVLLSQVVAIVTLGMGVAFVAADVRSPTSRALGTAFIAFGVAIGLSLPLGGTTGPVPPAGRWLAIADGIALIASLEWVRRVRRTIDVEHLHVGVSDVLLRVGQGACRRLCPRGHSRAAAAPRRIPGCGQQPSRPGKAGLLAVRVADARGDRRGRHRHGAAARRAPRSFRAPAHLGGDRQLPGDHRGPDTACAGRCADHRHRADDLPGRRRAVPGDAGPARAVHGAFLSPQVAKLVRERGLRHAVQHRNLEISVVACDLRGFTAFAQAHPSSSVIKTLREYYNAVGGVVAEYGGTVKDYAGDGILILVGAPLPVERHASVAVEMAWGIRAVAAEVCRRWSTPAHAIGIGVGVATGPVTVGIIGSASRWEYTAVGPAVNLASRLCSEAGNNQILIDARTAELAQTAGLVEQPPLSVKGFAEPVASFVLPL